jgi:hypothetical protein
LARRIGFSLLTVLAVAACIEGLGGLALWQLAGEFTTPRAIESQRQALFAPEADGGDWFRHRLRYEDALHPYLGYVADPGQHPTATLPGFDPTAAELGFPRNRESLLTPRRPDEVVVLLLGGSVAHLLADAGADALREALEGAGRFAEKRIRVVSAAMPGYKQPQQLMALAWLITLGAPIDVVVNLDGFNELALPATEHARAGVFPFYPRGWKVRVDRLGSASQQLIAQQATTQRERQSLADTFSAEPLASSFAASAMWLALDRRATTALAALDAALLARQAEARSSYQARGPAAPYGEGDALLTTLADAWERTSKAIAGLASSQGFEYFHFLQPNQYAAGGKTLTDKERTIAWRADHPYRAPIEAGYPLLEARGESLRAAGVRFESLVPVFANVSETLYIDDCCHFNKEGLVLVATAIAENIRMAGDR